MRAITANRHELWVSFAVVAIAVLFQAVPIGFEGALVLGGGMVVGLVCAINAVLDHDEMGAVETYVAAVWFIGLLIATPMTLWWLLTMREFASK